MAKESEFKDQFPECDIGAMPPFGNLYGMAVYVDESLTKDKDIASQCRHPRRVAAGFACGFRTAGHAISPEVCRTAGPGVNGSMASLMLEKLLAGL